ncbi:MAG: cation:proton antiporter, partial [Muribaculaceae bacterium]|nr:cation:proton antiporter [Muribaculaceae bacterium]
IIIKAFNDLGLQQKKFASLVFAVLIVEDLFAVLMMVILSSIAVNNSVEGGDMLYSIGKLVFFLIIWFLVGVYVLPSLLNLVRRYLNDETLLIVSIGLCLGMAVFSVLCGFSLALGAFVMGSILAGTSYAERIEKVTVPVKDLFGSVFFISVGMMVQPDIIVEYWSPILILSGVVIVGMIIFGTAGMLATGQSLRVAMESGFSLTQIGEFAFIIASLGMSLGVLEPTVYPIVVAVSVITTFTTPYFIKAADPCYYFVERHMPGRLRFLIDRYSRGAASQGAEKVWGHLIKRYLWRIVLYTIILIAIIIIATRYVEPWLDGLIAGWSKIVTALLALTAMSPFLLAMSLPTSKREERRKLSETYKGYRIPLMIMSIFRLIIVLAFIVYLLTVIFSLAVGIIGGVIILFLILFVFSQQIRESMRRIESKFLNNLNERELRRSGRNNSLVSDLHLAFMHVGFGCPFVGKRLVNSPLRSKYGVSVVNIQRGGKVIPIPSGDTRLFPGDTVGLIGTDDQIQQVIPLIEKDEPDGAGTGNRVMSASDFKLVEIELKATSPLVGKTIMEADVRRNYQAHIVAIGRDDSYVSNILESRLQAGDVIWVVGAVDKIEKLK